MTVSKNDGKRVNDMKILAVDPDPAELLCLTESLRETGGGISVESFCDPLAAVKFAYGNEVDEVYTVLAMKRMRGEQMAALLRKRNPGIRFRFIVDGGAPCTDELRSLADGFIFRPFSRKTLQRTLKLQNRPDG